MASADLGGLGRTESDPAVCSIQWQWPIIESLPFLLLAGVLLLARKRNNAGIVLGAFVGMSIVWVLGKFLTVVPSELREVGQPVIQSLLYGLALILLLSSRLVSATRLARLLKGTGVIAVSAAITFYGLIDVDNDRIAMQAWISLLVVGAATMAGLALGACVHRRWPSLLAFMCSLSLGCFTCLAAILLAIMLATGGLEWRILLSIAGVLAAAVSIAFAPLLLALFRLPSQAPRLKELFG